MEAKDTVSRFIWSSLPCGIPNTSYRTNHFKSRDIFPSETGTNVHSSVKVRMDNLKEKYEPRAKLPDVVNWVD